MLLVPRQLRRSGMTGNVPYYGGRFTPAQAYAASHASAAEIGELRDPRPQPMRRAAVPAAPQPATRVARIGGESRAALQHLLSTGVITEAEYHELRARVAR
jgi:hypothetical protein